MLSIHRHFTLSSNKVGKKAWLSTSANPAPRSSGPVLRRRAGGTERDGRPGGHDRVRDDGAASEGPIACLHAKYRKFHLRNFPFFSPLSVQNRALVRA